MSDFDSDKAEENSLNKSALFRRRSIRMPVPPIEVEAIKIPEPMVVVPEENKTSDKILPDNSL